MSDHRDRVWPFQRTKKERSNVPLTFSSTHAFGFALVHQLRDARQILLKRLRGIHVCTRTSQQGDPLITTLVIVLTSRQFKLLQRSTFSEWRARDEGRATTVKDLLAKYSAFVIRNDGALLGVATDSMGRSKRHMLDARFVDEKAFKALQFQFPSVEEET